jgi:hypothetical protein
MGVLQTVRHVIYDIAAFVDRHAAACALLPAAAIGLTAGAASGNVALGLISAFVTSETVVQAAILPSRRLMYDWHMLAEARRIEALPPPAELAEITREIDNHLSGETLRARFAALEEKNPARSESEAAQKLAEMKRQLEPGRS